MMATMTLRYGPDQIEVTEPSPEMARISSLIEETEGRIKELESELAGKCRTLAESEAGRVLDEGDKSAAIKAGLSRKAVDVLQDEIRDAQRVFEGLKIKHDEAEQVEQERLHSELIDKIKTDGQKLLSVLDEIDHLAKRFNEKVVEAGSLMELTFWKVDAEKILGVFGCRLPQHCCRKVLLPDDSTPSHLQRNFFVARLKEFCES